MWNPVCRPPSGLVPPVPVDPDGRHGLTRGQAAGPLWRRTSRGLYVPVGVASGLPEQRILEQAARLPADGVVTGWAACRLHGAAYFDGHSGGYPAGGSEGGLSPVTAVVPPTSRMRSGGGLRVTREPIDPAETVVRSGIRCAAPVRAVFDALREAGSWREAVVAMDMAAAARVSSVAEMTAYVADRPQWRRARQVARALRFASDRSGSPAETRARLLWEVDARLPRPLVNREVFTREGRLVGVADLLDPVAGMVVEYDGADHLRVVRRAQDLAREERMRRLGLEYATVVAPDLRRPAETVRRLLSTRDRARFESEEERRWTTEPPPGWPRERSLDEELFLRQMAEDLHRATAGAR